MAKALIQDPFALPYLLRVKAWDKAARALPSDPSLSFCYDILNTVSRSFSIVIQQLGPELRDAVCVFYLVLRGLDTVEDDMSIPKDIKIPQLRTFYQKITNKSFFMTCGTGHYIRLMKEFPKVVDAFLKLKPQYQAAITDVTKRMGAGMADFISKEVVTHDDYDLYCHYVAGLVGIGLSHLFAASELESSEFTKMEALSNGMGLFLQKTNIIRDYLEDICEEPAPRMFWPRDVWGKYADELVEFKSPKNSEQAVQCLNELVTNALQHAMDSLSYMKKLKEPTVFRFCAIPQVMAIATLSECYDNRKVFSAVVKIPRGLSARIMVNTSTLADVAASFQMYARRIAEKVNPADPSAKDTLDAIEAIDAECASMLARLPKSKPTAEDSLSLAMQLIMCLLVLALALILAQMVPIK